MRKRKRKGRKGERKEGRGKKRKPQQDCYGD
jgi:hypothetical protein